MTRFRQALLVSALATGAVTVAWMWVSGRRTSGPWSEALPAERPPQGERTRAEEIEELTQQQKDLMLRELSQHL